MNECQCFFCGSIVNDKEPTRCVGREANVSPISPRPHLTLSQ